MTIGLPRALLYYRFAHLWKTFFTELGCTILVSPHTNQSILDEGISASQGECCLPVKVFLGHVAYLAGRCDYVLIPRFEAFKQGEEFCVRFWGIPDIVRNTFPSLPLIGYNLQGNRPGSQWLGFLSMGRRLRKPYQTILRAYHQASKVQLQQNHLTATQQQLLLSSSKPRILLASHPYLIHDKFLGAPLVNLIVQQGGLPLFADRCPRGPSALESKALSSDLYWTLNKEIIGSIPHLRPHLDGILLVSAFPCGTDSLVNELVLRRVCDLPVAQIIIDEQQGFAGLQTRIECFMDILRERGCPHAG